MYRSRVSILKRVLLSIHVASMDFIYFRVRNTNSIKQIDVQTDFIRYSNISSGQYFYPAIN